MIVKALGILDIFIAVCFWIFGILNVLPERFILILGFILLIKGLVFIWGMSVASALDIIIGVIVIISTAVAMPKVMVALIALFLLQKGIFSLLS